MYCSTLGELELLLTVDFRAARANPIRMRGIVCASTSKVPVKQSLQTSRRTLFDLSSLFAGIDGEEEAKGKGSASTLDFLARGVPADKDDDSTLVFFNTAMDDEDSVSILVFFDTAGGGGDEATRFLVAGIEVMIFGAAS